MHTFLNAKTMAKTLRAALAERSVDISHSDSLELVARQFGLADWNTLSAKIERAQPADLPPGWHPHHGGGDPVHAIGRDNLDPNNVTIVSTASADEVGERFATLMQSIGADDYRGQTVRLSADLRGEDVGQGVLWMRIDAQNAVGRAIRFDNMLSRSSEGAMRGNFGWTERHILLDVPQEAGTIHFGPMLKGAGQLWARNLRLESVGDHLQGSVTGLYPRRPTGFGDGVPA
ncbi:MAG: glyoxalase superfamily protein [Devosia sp.]